MIYLLDSNAWIAFLRRPNSPVVARLQAQQPGDIRVLLRGGRGTALRLLAQCETGSQSRQGGGPARPLM